MDGVIYARYPLVATVIWRKLVLLGMRCLGIKEYIVHGTSSVGELQLCVSSNKYFAGKHSITSN